jgi:ribosomal protein L40E
MCYMVQDGTICPKCNFVELIGKPEYVFCPQNTYRQVVKVFNCRGGRNGEKFEQQRLAKKLCWKCERENGPTQNLCDRCKQEIREPPPYSRRV